MNGSISGKIQNGSMKGSLIPGGASNPVLQAKSTTTNGTVTPDSGYDGLSSVSVNVTPSLQSKSVTINGTVTADSGYYGLSSVNVNVSASPVLQSKTVTTNGTVTADSGYDGLSSVFVNVSGGGATEPYAELTLDSGGNITGAKLYGFTSIPDNMFYNYNYLETVDFSRSPNLTSIGNHAFYDCSNLSLSSLPSGITSIGDSAFEDCSNLSLSSLPSGITSIGNYAFNGCRNLSLSSLPSGITSIGGSAFYGCRNLSLSSLPSGITSIGGSAFYGCSNISISYLPSSLTSLGTYSFGACLKITRMEIACSTLAKSTFYCCQNLQNVWIRSSCIVIIASASSSSPFSYCPDNLNIYAEPTSKPSGWSEYFNRTGDSGGTTVNVVYGQTTRPW